MKQVKIDQFICPVCQDYATNPVVSRINISEMCDYIKDYVTSGGEIDIIQMGSGFKFIKK